MRYPREVEGLIVKKAAGKYGTIEGDAGYGIFAKRSYRRGELIVRVTGRRVKGTDPNLTHRGVQVGRRSFIEPLRFSSIWYLNHSCSPNAYVDGDALIARRDVAPGEEITADYSLFTDYQSWDMVCGCGSQGCRGVIVPFSRLKSKPKSFISSYLKKTI